MRQPYPEIPQAERDSRSGRHTPPKTKPIISRESVKRLAKAFLNDPESFEKRWEEKLSKYLTAIHLGASNGARLRDHRSQLTPSIFGVVDEAMQTLRSIGVDALRQHGPETYDILADECVRALGQQIMPQLRRYKQHRWCI